MELITTVHEFENEVKEMTGKFKKKLGEEVFDDEFDTETIELMTGLFKMLDTSTKLVVQQAETIHTINEKLDKLLAREERV
jgi:hypothetical protein